jgi:hypothetical protein
MPLNSMDTIACPEKVPLEVSAVFTRLPGETAEIFGLRRTINVFLHSKGQTEVSKTDWVQVLGNICRTGQTVESEGPSPFISWLTSLMTTCQRPLNGSGSVIPTSGTADDDSPPPLSPTSELLSDEAPSQECAGETILRLRVNQGLRAKGRPELSRKEWVNVLGDLLSNHRPQVSNHGLKLCPGGYCYIPTPADGATEWCTFEFRHQSGAAEVSIAELRFLTTSRVYEIRQHLSDRLAKNAGLGQSPFLLCPGTEELLPCLLSAHQVIALARGQDATSTPVDTIIYAKVDPNLMDPNAFHGDLCCLNCHLAGPAEGWDGSCCHRSSQPAEERAVDPGTKQIGQIWQI